MERRLAAILAADVVGYSRLMGADEAGTLTHLKACETEIVDPLVDDHSGRMVKRMGDGYLVEFASVVDAVECAMAWQARARDPIFYRIGINLGDVMVQDGDLYGDGVNVAARLEALAPTGGICLSEDAWRQARGKVKAEFEDLGPAQLKNIAEAVTVYRLTTDASDVPGAPLPEAQAPATLGALVYPSVMLTAFRALGDNADAVALAAGITETLAAALVHFEEFELIDPGSAGEAIGTAGTRAAGRQLGATYILEGTLQLALGKARIGVQLVEVDSSQRVWSETLDRSLDDVFALQDDITAFIASTMGEAVGEEQARAIAQKPDAELTLLELQTRGVQHLHRGNPEDNLIARGYFEQVLALKPDHYMPTLCLCWTYAIELAGGYPSTRADALDYSLILMRDMMRRHDRSAHIHRLVSRLMFLKGDFAQGLSHAERACELNPYHSDMMMNHGLALMYHGRGVEAVDRMERALAMNPYLPPSFKIHLSLAYYLQGRHEDGLDALNSLNGGISNSRSVRILHLVALGREPEAKSEAQTVLAETPDYSIARVLAGIPFANPEYRKPLADALQQAGLPE